MTDATMDAAANTALLLEQYIHEKIMRALVDITLPKYQAKAVTDTLDFGATIEYAATEFRRMLMHSVSQDQTFVTNLRYLVMNIVQEEFAKLAQARQDLDMLIKAATLMNNKVMPKEYNDALHQVAASLQTRVPEAKRTRGTP